MRQDGNAIHENMFGIGVVVDAGERYRCSFEQFAGELQYLSERFWNGFSGVVENVERWKWIVDRIVFQ